MTQQTAEPVALEEKSAIPTRALVQLTVALRIFVGLDWFGNVIAKIGLLLLAELMAIDLTFKLLTRIAAIGGLLLLGTIWLMLLHTNQYLWTYPLDLFPLLLPAIVPAGRVAGLDGKIIRKLSKVLRPP
ncbi:hypothetical protein AB0F91_22975 [Amycolatopsis sp. NPDC023774]|uniref:hypothetical protein n=1 Tax=Amycolatopsis sp. NPDC023774 TaxID=3155015 RepID=UPI003409C746